MIRDARPEELSALASAVAPQPLLTRYQITAEKLTQNLTGAIARGDGLIVAEEEGVARGFAWFVPTGTFALGGYLRLIALAPGSEGNGLGGRLLDEVERRVAQASKSIFLLVSHWNDGARRFYAARGYAEVGKLPAFVRADTDEIVMMKRLG